MPGTLLQPIAQYLRQAACAGDAGVTDAQLLERYRANGDATAFEVLVWRHGALVWGVCRRLLRDRHLAEDAFQATFLVLIRKAHSIRGQAISSWLYRVACRIAQRARQVASRTAARERTDGELTSIEADAPPCAGAAFEEALLVTEELAGLPQKYRAPVVLCYLQGKAYSEAARLLGCPLGTIASRLGKARSLLRARLSRRGVQIGAAALTLELSPRTNATPPPTLVDTACRAAHLSQLGKSLAGAVSERAIGLAKGVMHTMFATKLKQATAVVLTVLLALAGAGWLGFQSLGSADEQPARTLPPRDPKAALATERTDEVEQLKRENFRLHNRLELLEKEIEWLRRDLEKLDAKRSPRPPESLPFRWKFEKNKAIFQDVTVETNQSMKVLGNDSKQTQKQTMVFRWTPVEQDERQNWTLRLAIEQIELQIDIGGNRIDYDSRKPAKDLRLADSLEALVGQELRIKMGPDYKILEIQGKQEMLAKLNKAQPQLKGVYEQIANTLIANDLTRSIFHGLPKTPVRVGDSWSDTDIIETGPIGGFLAQYRFTYDGPDGALDKVSFRGTLTHRPQNKEDAGQLPFRVLQANLNTKEVRGAYWFNRAAGRLDRLELEMDLNGQLEIEIGGQKAKVDLRQLQKTKVQIRDR
jgi:RNA polymerase sigma factor (sigma-70 family)